MFFTLGGTNYVCSANAVGSDNRNIVSTAGHCVTTASAAFATKFTFVPAYLTVASPYGNFVPPGLHATTQWDPPGSNKQYDVGLCGGEPAPRPQPGRRRREHRRELQRRPRPGLQGLRLPGSRPVQRQNTESCSGTATNDPYSPEFNYPGHPCNMTGGSSGGPWFIGTSSSGYQNSVNSYGYGTNSTKMYGPYWGSVIQQAYNSASSAS